MSTVYIPKAEGATAQPAQPAPAAEPSHVDGSKIEYHEVANLFPMMSEIDLGKLADDIRVNGLREHIWLHEGKIIDGRNRYEACKIAGKAPEFRNWEGKGSLVNFALSINLNRRHLSDSQRALVASNAKKAFEAEGLERRNANLVQNKAASENLVPGSSDSEGRDEAEQQNKTSTENLDPGSSSAKAAKALNVSKDAVEKASRVQKKGDNSLVQELVADRVSLDAAAAVATLPKDEQREIVAQGKVKEAAKALRDAKKPQQEKVEPSTPVKSPAQSHDSKVVTEVEPPTSVKSPPQVSGTKAVSDAVAVIAEYHSAFVAAGKHKTAEARLVTFTNSLRNDIETLRNPPSPTVDSAPTPIRTAATEISNVLLPVSDKPQVKSKYDPVLGF